MGQLAPRRDVYDYGLVPLHNLCPHLGDLHTLQKLHAQLLSRSIKSLESGENLASSQDVQDILDLSVTQLQILCGVLTPLSLCLPPDGIPSPGESHQQQQQTMLSVHELSMFLLAQLFSREAQRPDITEVWPETGPSLSPLSVSDNMCSSPTRTTMSRSPSGKAMLRQQLQQHLRNQNHAMRNYGDFLRRNLTAIAEFALNSLPPQRQPSLSLGISSTQPHPSTLQANITAAEVDRMQFLIQPTRQHQVTALSSLVPGLKAGAGVPLDVVTSTLRALWIEEVVGAVTPGGLGSPRIGSPGGHPFSIGSPNSGSPSPKTLRHSGLLGSQGQADEALISGIHKGTVVRGETDTHGGMLRISDCHDAVIYVLTPLQCVLVSGCSDCTIVVGACGKILRLDRCDKVQLIAAAARLLVSSCHNCTMYLGITSPAMLIGDCRFLRLAPFNAHYERQMAHARAVGLRLDLPNHWDTPLVLAGKERKNSSSSTSESPQPGGSGKGAVSMYSLLPPDDFLPFVVPFQGGSGALAGGSAPAHSTAWRHLAPAIARTSATAGSATQVPAGGVMYLFPLPVDYEKVLLRKLAMTGELRQRFRQVGLSKDKERELNDTIQSHFKEWLSSSNMLRQIYDLSNLEKEEGGNLSGGFTPPAKEKTTLTL